mmetsp:Transcript_47655/g.98332  ORF Transcript_47655/g.98332 Transcript_47655/m.98332 type:complete len:241 (+) Transcript_47655:466-1188(+)
MPHPLLLGRARLLACSSLAGHTASAAENSCPPAAPGWARAASLQPWNLPRLCGRAWASSCFRGSPGQLRQSLPPPHRNKEEISERNWASARHSTSACLRRMRGPSGPWTCPPSAPCPSAALKPRRGSRSVRSFSGTCHGSAPLSVGHLVRGLIETQHSGAAQLHGACGQQTPPVPRRPGSTSRRLSVWWASAAGKSSDASAPELHFPLRNTACKPPVVAHRGHPPSQGQKADIPLTLSQR